MTEKAKYTFKSEDSIRLDQPSAQPVQMSGTLTFLTNADANTFWANLKTIIASNQVIYAKFDLTQNAHHWSDARVPPDIIVDQLILGDVNAIPAGVR